jgi:hypothetical protein
MIRSMSTNGTRPGNPFRKRIPQRDTPFAAGPTVWYRRLVGARVANKGVGWPDAAGLPVAAVPIPLCHLSPAGVLRRGVARLRRLPVRGRVIAELDRDVPDGDALDRADTLQHVGG